MVATGFGSCRSQCDALGDCGWTPKFVSSTAAVAAGAFAALVAVVVDIDVASGH